MPGHFVHCIMAPAIDVGGRVYPGLSNAADYASVGTLLFISTSAHRLSQYEVFHSYAEYGFGPFGEQWELLGTAQTYLGCVDRLVTMRSMIDLVGAIHMEGYVFSAGDETSDFYVRASTNRPVFRYAHYKIAIADPGQFWRARGYTFVERADKPEWAHRPMARAQQPMARL